MDKWRNDQPAAWPQLYSSSRSQLSSPPENCPDPSLLLLLLLLSCFSLCNPIDGSPPGSAILGILQARTLEWVAISFSNAWKWKVKVKSLSRVRPSRPHGLQPTRLLCPRDFPGKNTGVGCHCLLWPPSKLDQMFLLCTPCHGPYVNGNFPCLLRSSSRIWFPNGTIDTSNSNRNTQPCLLWGWNTTTTATTVTSKYYHFLSTYFMPATVLFAFHMLFEWDDICKMLIRSLGL